MIVELKRTVIKDAKKTVLLLFFDTNLKKS